MTAVINPMATVGRPTPTTPFTPPAIRKMTPTRARIWGSGMAVCGVLEKADGGMFCGAVLIT